MPDYTLEARPGSSVVDHFKRDGSRSAPGFVMKTVLLVDTLDHHRSAVKWFLGNFGYLVDSVCSAEEALAVFDVSIHDIVVTDLDMAGMNGSEMAHVIKLRSPSTPMVMYSRRLPQDQSCLDAVIQKSDHLLVEHHLLLMKETLDRLLATDFQPKDT
jgi:CheY-like chemotaxis protein